MLSLHRSWHYLRYDRRDHITHKDIKLKQYDHQGGKTAIS